MGRPLKIAKLQGTIVVDRAIPGTINTQPVGGVGGLTSIAGNQIQPRVKIGAASNANGSILRQKGRKKFLVTDGSNVGVCTLVDKADGSLANNEMSITATRSTAATFRANRISNRYVWDFDNKRYIWTFGTAQAATATAPEIVSIASA
jgi:hypothetical protein